MLDTLRPCTHAPHWHMAGVCTRCADLARAGRPHTAPWHKRGSRRKAQRASQNTKDKKNA